MIRASRDNPCRVCGGWPGLPRGKGERCTGFISDDGKYIHCTREENAGTLQPDDSNPATYAHLDSEECNCGTRHLSYGSAPAKVMPVRKKVASKQSWPIRDVNNGLVGHHVRVEYEGGAKDYKWEPLGLDPRTMIYGAELLRDNQLPAIVTEGEKACDALRTFNLTNVVIVAIVTGAPGPRLAPSSLALFHGRRVYPWADNDEVGRTQMEMFTADLTGLADVRPIVWGEQDKDDAADFVERGGTKAGLAELVRVASERGKIIELPGMVPQLLETDAQEVKKSGLGYVGTWPRQQIRLSFKRVHTRRDDVTGLLEVTRGEKPLFFGSFHVASLSSRESVGKWLRKTTAGYDGWEVILETFAREVLHMHTEGDDIEELDDTAEVIVRPPLIHPWLPELEPTTIYGPGEAGKSTIAAAAAVSVATGADYLDWTPRVGRVLILDWEADKQAWLRRMDAIARGAGLTRPRVGYRRCTQPLADDVERLAEYVQEHEVRLLIIDSMTAAAGPRDMGEDLHGPVNRLHDALRLIGTSSLIIDHVPKDEHGEGKGHNTATPIGTVMKIDRVRSAWEVRGETEPVLPGQERQVSMLHRKVNEGARLAPQHIGITWSEDATQCTLRAGVQITAPELVNHAGSMADLIADALSQARGSMRVADIAEEIGAKEANVRGHLERHTDRFFKVSRGVYGLAQWRGETM